VGVGRIDPQAEILKFPYAKAVGSEV